MADFISTYGLSVGDLIIGRVTAVNAIDPSDASDENVTGVVVQQEPNAVTNVRNGDETLEN